MKSSESKILAWHRLPNSIRVFIFAYLVSVALGAVNSLQQFESLRLRVMDLVELLPEVFYPTDGWVYGLLAFRIGFSIGLLVWVLVRHSLIGRLIIAAQVLGAIVVSPTGFALLAKGDFGVLPFVLSGLSAAVAGVCLLMKSARGWFSRKGRTLADDLEDFS